MLVGISDGSEATRVVAGLASHGYHGVDVASTEEELLTLARSLATDMVILDARLTPSGADSALQQLQQERLLPVLMVVDPDHSESFPIGFTTGVVGYLARPLREGDLRVAIEAARAVAAELAALRERIDRLERMLETRRIVDRAKSVLMNRDGYSEQDAHLYIHRRSRNERRPTREIAEEVLATLSDA